MKRFEYPSAGELETLRQVIAASPILVASRPAPSTVIPDWENVRHSSAVDAVVLAWIASHVRTAGHRRPH
jgi:hypothetical protein